MVYCLLVVKQVLCTGWSYNPRIKTQSLGEGRYKTTQEVLGFYAQIMVARYWWLKVLTNKYINVSQMKEVSRIVIAKQVDCGTGDQ